jgi:multidrug efflux pump subunit AcrB
VIVQLPRASPRDRADLGDLYVASTRLDRERLADAGAAAPGRGVRRDRQPAADQASQLQRRISIYGNAQGRASGDVGSDAERVVKAMKLPPGYRFDLSGGSRR